MDLFYDPIVDPLEIAKLLLQKLTSLDKKLGESLAESALNPINEQGSFSSALKWLKAAWPKDGITTSYPSTEKMGRAMNVLMAEQRISRKSLCVATGISYPYLSEFSQGNKMPSEDKLHKVSDALGINLSAMIRKADALPDLTSE
jgi:hypothetical protein